MLARDSTARPEKRDGDGYRQTDTDIDRQNRQGSGLNRQVESDTNRQHPREVA